MKNFTVITLLLILTLSSVLAQVPTRKVNPIYFAKINKRNTNFKSPVIRMPKIDVAKLQKEDADDRSMDLPFRFGEAIDVDIEFSDGKWQNEGNYNVEFDASININKQTITQSFSHSFTITK